MSAFSKTVSYLLSLSQGQLVFMATLLLLLSCGGLLYVGYETPNTMVISTATTPSTSHLPSKTNTATSIINPKSQLTLNHPEVTMDAERGLLVAKLAVSAHLPNLTSPVVGYVSVTGKPRLVEANKQFFLTEATIVSVDLGDLPQGARTQFNKELTHAVSLFFQQYAAYAPLNNGAIQSSELSIEF